MIAAARRRWFSFATGFALCFALMPAYAQIPKAAVAKYRLVQIETSPFPYRGMIPELNVPFIDKVEGERQGHTAPRSGRVYWEVPTYSDRRAIFYIPKGFDPNRPAIIVVFFHGNEARLERDVRDRQQVLRQLSDSGLNAVLVAPQFAVDAIDSSSGHFWDPGHWSRFLAEAAKHLTALYGDPRVAPVFESAPVVLAAYSGGYQAAAYSLERGGASERMLGLILLDAVYAEEDKFADWIAKRGPAFFISAYGKASASSNALLQKLLRDRGIAFGTNLPARLAPGTAAFVAVGPDVVHNNFVTAAWTADPLKVLLARIPGYPRVAPPPPKPARKPR